ncbi:MAG: ATP-binding protein [Actinomycetota bacterium]|nr:ATP-binding protein [Actinomycetota bacterium]
MTRALLVLVPLATALASIAGTRLPAPFAAIVGAGLGLAAAAWLWSRQQHRVDSMAREINRWLGLARHAPLRVPGGASWQHLAVAVNALGAAYSRRGERLERERQFHGDFVEALPEPALLFDRDGHLLHANEASRDWFHLGTHQQVTGPPAAYGVPVLTVAQTVGSGQLAQVVDEVISLGRKVETEAQLAGRDLVAVAVPVADEVLVALSDRTEQRRVDALRRDFVANASHELKTPVSGIQALSEALCVTVDRDPERARALVERMGGEAERLGTLVRDLLDLHRLEDDSADLRRGLVDLAALVRHEVERLGPLGAEQAIEVETDLPKRALMGGVEEDLRLIVANLLDNAVGYNRPGGKVAVRLHRVDGDWQLDVHDTGIGIPRQDLDRIFERFYRVDVARSRATGGTGLGLSIVRHATERHGGKVMVESVLGEGSTFHVVLPVEPAA